MQRPSTVQPSQPAQAAVATSTTPVPTTRAELEALHQKRAELRGQLETGQERREQLREQLSHADPRNDREGMREIQARIRALDARSARLEQEIHQADDAITAAVSRGVAAPTYVTVTSAPPAPLPPPGSRGVDKDVFATVVVGMSLLFTLAGVLIHRLATRRAERDLAHVSAGGGAQLQQLQQAVDVIAVEVERIAEGQRFVSRLLSERLQVPSAQDTALPAPNASDSGSATRR